ncbi:hypothetical protein B6259_08090 [Ruminococcaceae bacterium CPB6]|nr:hypothetical protein B6259_08090 [Ruminococcaceae bacterium CPB6]
MSKFIHNPFSGQISSTKAAFEDVSQYRDIETCNAYRDLCKKHPGQNEKVMRAIHFKSRDNARPPMQ